MALPPALGVCWLCRLLWVCAGSRLLAACCKRVLAMPPACGVCWEMWLGGCCSDGCCFLDEIYCYFVFGLWAFWRTLTSLKLPCVLQVPLGSVLGGECLQHTLEVSVW